LGKESIMRGKTFSTLQMQQPKADAADKGAPAPRHVEFVMYSTPDSEAKK
jgi:hypothetical protein